MAPKRKVKPVCKYGDECYRKSDDHLANYEHKTTEASSMSTSKEEEKLSEIANENICPNNDSIKKQKLNEDERECGELNEASVEKHDMSKITDIKEFIKEEYKMEMPADFYDLVEFLKSLDPKKPKEALRIIGLELTGAYDLLISGLKLNYKIHSRFYYDPPEFQTVIKVIDSDTDLHFGYFRDDPNQLPDFVAINEAKLNCKIYPKGDNLFSAIIWYLNELISGKKFNSTIKSQQLKDLKEKLTKWFNKHYESDKKFSLELLTPKMKLRLKEKNCDIFHGAGIYIKIGENGCGYRELQETYESLKKLFSNYCLKDVNEPGNKTKKTKADEKIQEFISYIQFANDEMDYGMGLEFGLNMFCHGDVSLHKFIRTAAINSYQLLGRGYYSEILKEHLKIRKI